MHMHTCTQSELKRLCFTRHPFQAFFLQELPRMVYNSLATILLERLFLQCMEEIYPFVLLINVRHAHAHMFKFMDISELNLKRLCFKTSISSSFLQQFPRMVCNSLGTTLLKRLVFTKPGRNLSFCVIN